MDNLIKESMSQAANTKGLMFGLDLTNSSSCIQELGSMDSMDREVPNLSPPQKKARRIPNGASKKLLHKLKLDSETQISSEEFANWIKEPGDTIEIRHSHLFPEVFDN